MRETAYLFRLRALDTEAMADVDAPVVPTPLASRWRRLLPWALLVLLLGVAQTLLLALTVQHENNREQERVEMAAASAAANVRQLLLRDVQSLQALLWNDPQPAQWRSDAADLLRARREMLRIEWRSGANVIETAADSPYGGPLFVSLARSDLDLDTQAACADAQRLAAPAWSRSYFVPQPGGLGVEVIDVCLPIGPNGERGAMVATLALGGVIDEAVAPELARSHELSFVEGDGTRLARGGLTRGAGVYVTERLVNLSSLTLALRLDSAAGAPRLIPNVATSLVLGLSLALAAVVALLARDVRRRAAAEQRLGEELTLRRAMEDSLVTGLRARDRQGRVTYVNPAFCKMVGFSAEQLVGQTTPPYWPPEMLSAYEARQVQRMAQGVPAHESRDGFETTFMRAGGERFPVLIFEAPLVGPDGLQSGWMSAVLDLSAQRRVEERARQQQEQLQATARLASVGEMASLLSHELNQPLAAIASYATGSLNLIDDAGERPDPPSLAMIREATQHIAEQAERAGRVIRSVHDFVRRREQSRESLSCDQLVEAVMPLLRLQARKCGARIEFEFGSPPPRVVCDRTMVEQVLLNLTRNALQAMVGEPAERRVVRLGARTHGAWVRLSVTDHGPGIEPEVAARLFTPFFTTKAEGMGLGLSLCRTVVEQHGGALDFTTLRDGEGRVRGTCFEFTLPAAGPAASPAAAPPGVLDGVTA